MHVQKDDKQDAAAMLNPAERVSAVRPMWEQRQHDDRVQLLTVDVETLRQQAKTVAEKQRANAGGQCRHSKRSSLQSNSLHRTAGAVIMPGVVSTAVLSAMRDQDYAKQREHLQQALACSLPGVSDDCVHSQACSLA